MNEVEQLPSVTRLEDRIVVNYNSALDGRSCEETISSRDVVRIVLEHTELVEGCFVHWFLHHRDGWTLHFNDRFRGADQVTAWLQSRFEFVQPSADEIAGSGSDGTVVWGV